MHVNNKELGTQSYDNRAIQSPPPPSRPQTNSGVSTVRSRAGVSRGSHTRSLSPEMARDRVPNPIKQREVEGKGSREHTRHGVHTKHETYSKYCLLPTRPYANTIPLLTSTYLGVLHISSKLNNTADQFSRPPKERPLRCGSWYLVPRFRHTPPGSFHSHITYI